jgi:hypothetical protein
MKTIEFSPNGEAVSDVLCEENARHFLQNDWAIFISVSSSNFITAARVCICEGIIDHKEVRFLYQGQYLHPSADGRLLEWPMGFCDTEEKLLLRLILGRKKE